MGEGGGPLKGLPFSIFFFGLFSVKKKYQVKVSDSCLLMKTGVKSEAMKKRPPCTVIYLVVNSYSSCPFPELWSTVYAGADFLI